MKEYPIHLGDRDTLNEDLKPIRRRSLLHVVIGAAITLFGVNQLAKGAYVSGRAEVINDLQTEIDKQEAIKLMSEKEEQ